MMSAWALIISLVKVLIIGLDVASLDPYSPKSAKLVHLCNYLPAIPCLQKEVLSAMPCTAISSLKFLARLNITVMTQANMV